MKNPDKKTFNKRAVVAIALFIVFILLPISGKMIEIMIDNPTAKYVWGAIHYSVGLLFTVLGLFHIVYNWGILKKYMKKK